MLPYAIVTFPKKILLQIAYPYHITLFEKKMFAYVAPYNLKANHVITLSFEGCYRSFMESATYLNQLA